MAWIGHVEDVRKSLYRIQIGAHYLHLLATSQLNLSPTKPLISSDRNSGFVSLQTNSYRSVASRFVPRATHAINAKPVLKKMFDAMRRDELVLHLSFKAASLKLHILSTAVRQLIDPDVAVLVSPPRPCLLARQLAMVCDVDHTPIRLFVIDAEIVSFGITRKKRKEVGHFTKPADVDSFLNRKLEDRPECVRVRFAHRIVET